MVGQTLFFLFVFSKRNGKLLMNYMKTKDERKFNKIVMVNLRSYHAETTRQAELRWVIVEEY